jgi:hypothetical protein
MSSADRRKYPRLEGEFPVDLLNMGDDPRVSRFEAIVSGNALDVSLQGMRLRVSYNVPVNSILSVIVYFRGHESVCLCQVVWKVDQGREKLYGLYIKEWSKLDSMLERRLNSMTLPPPTQHLSPTPA